MHFFGSFHFEGEINFFSPSLPPYYIIHIYTQIHILASLSTSTNLLSFLIPIARSLRSNISLKNKTMPQTWIYQLFASLPSDVIMMQFSFTFFILHILVFNLLTYLFLLISFFYKCNTQKNEEKNSFEEEEE